jgi:hypothetical protein
MPGKWKNYDPIWRRIKWAAGYGRLTLPLPLWWSSSKLQVELADIDAELRPRFRLPAEVQQQFKDIDWKRVEKRTANWDVVKTRVADVTENPSGMHTANTLAVAVYGPLLNNDRRHHNYNFAEQFCFDGRTLKVAFPELCETDTLVATGYQVATFRLKREVIDGLKDGEKVRIRTPHGSFVFTRQQFETAFPQIASNKASYLDKGSYSVTIPPQVAKQFLDFDGSKLPDDERYPIVDALKLVVDNGIVDAPELTDNTSDSPNLGTDDNRDDDDEVDSRYHARNVILFGPPGTGKSYRLQTTFLAGIGIGPDDKRVFRVTFHPETSYFDFVGSYKPLLGLERADSPALAIDGTEMRLPGGEPARPVVYYGFEPGPFAEALCAALAEPSRNHALIVEEINRGNCAAIFGDVFQLLDRDPEHRSQYAIRPSAPLATYLQARLKAPHTELRLPRNLFLYATMNTSDQALFPMDTAFKRRWSLEYVGIAFDDAKARQVSVPISEATQRPWWAVATALNRFIVAHTGIDDKQMGPYFVQPVKGDQVSPIAFRSKVLFYLWNDIFRGNPQMVFAEGIETYDSLVAAHRENRAVFIPAVLDAISSLATDPGLTAQ